MEWYWKWCSKKCYYWTKLRTYKKNSPRLLGSKIVIQLEEVLRKYDVELGDCELIFMHRRWLDLSEFTTDLGIISKNIDSSIVKEFYNKESQDLGLQKRLDSWELGRYNRILMG